MPPWAWMLLAVIGTPAGLAALMVLCSRDRDRDRQRMKEMAKPRLEVLPPVSQKRTGTDEAA